MKKPSRQMVALLLTLIYLLINLSPLAPLLTWSPVIAHALTGECAGDCDICGCSPERRADRTCCCWQKKLAHEHEQENVPDCCKTKHRADTPILTCNCPCGSKKQLGLWGTEKSEHLPYCYTRSAFPLEGETRFLCHADRLTVRHGEPPERPPKLAFLS